MTFSMFWALREKSRRAKNGTPSTRKPVFSRFAPAQAQAQGRQQKAKKATQNELEKQEKITKKLTFSGSRGRLPKISSKMWCRNLLRSLRGAPREAQDGPKRRQERPKTAPRAAGRAPRACQRRFRMPPWDLASKRSPEVPGS